ncbi:hypothetical protein JB92DRAFT_2854255 [Gautieria morchelliformis]|nr:hypothetical protein JB92DRAFT_2854255 [Gautieria morchelliformis]
MSSSDTSGSASAPDTRTRGTKRKRDDVPTRNGAKARTDAPEQRKEDAGGSSPSDSGSDSSSDDPDKNGDAPSQETQVISRAAQRKLKKKEQGKANGAQPQPNAESPPADLAPKRQHSVWVGNLAFKTTQQSLRAFFQRGVPGCEVTRVHLPTKTGNEVGGGKGMRGENRGFAYVDFATKEAKEQAIALSEQNLDGRKLLIKDGANFAGRPTVGSTNSAPAANSAVGKSRTAQRILAAQKQPPAPTLFMGNLGFHATDESIRSMLESHLTSLRQKPQKVGSNGEEDATKEDGDREAKATNGKKWLRKVRMGTFEDSGLCKGWAFVDFFNTEDATTVLLDTRNHYLDGRKLVLEYASAEAVRRGGGPGAREHRDKTHYSKGDTAKTANRVRGERKTEGLAPIQPEEAETLGGQGGPPQKKTKTFDGKERERGGKGKRAKPGAALALAKREKVAIVPSSGKKTIF